MACSSASSLIAFATCCGDPEICVKEFSANNNIIIMMITRARTVEPFCFAISRYECLESHGPEPSARASHWCSNCRHQRLPPAKRSLYMLFAEPRMEGFSKTCSSAAPLPPPTPTSDYRLLLLLLQLTTPINPCIRPVPTSFPIFLFDSRYWGVTSVTQ